VNRSHLLRFGAGLFLFGEGFALALKGPLAAQGFAIGYLAAAFNLWALWRGVGMFAMPTTQESTKAVAGLIVLVCFVKLPVFIFAGWLARSLGPAAEGAFLTGAGLVYCLLVGWAALRR